MAVCACACVGMVTAVGSASAAPLEFSANGGEFGTCLTSSGGGVGQQVKMDTCNIDSLNQEWDQESTSYGEAYQNVGDGLCMSDLGSSVIGYGAGIYMEDCNSSINQSFTPYVVEDESGYYVLVLRLAAKSDIDGETYALDSDGNDHSGANVIDEVLSQAEINDQNETWFFL